MVEQLKPVLSDVIGLIDQAQPALQSFSGAFGQGLSGAISAARGAFEQLSPVVSSAASVIGTAFTVAAPLLQQAGSAVSAVAGGMTSAFSAVGPAIEAAAPVMEQAGSVISAVAGGMSSAFGAIAPVIGSVVSGIMEKIGGVVSFLSERAGFIQEVISTVGSAIATVLSTAWSVASPVLDMMIAGFELVFSVVQKVWPGISSAISAAWKAISPVFDAIAKGAEMVGGAFKKVTGFLSGKGSGGGKAGRNARGDNNWRGGPTWVGEEGPELIDLPRGTRILPHKESVVLAAAAQERQAAVMEQPVPWSRGSTENAAAGPGAGAFPEVKVGRNARGDNSWRGGPTWVGENGPELIDLPRGTRILPHKESVIWASSQEERTVPKEGPRTAVREQKKAVPERPAALTRSIAESTAEDLPLVRVGKNAHGDDNWHGGPTWVGEEGPELIGLPYGPEPLPRKDRLIRAAFMPERPAFAPKRRRFGTEQRMPWAENGFGRTEAKVGAAAFPVPEDMQKTYGESGRRGNIFSGRRKPLKRMETLQEAAEQMPDEAPVQESAKAHASVERMQPLWRQSAAVIGFQAALRELRHRQVRRAEPGVPGGMRSGRPRRNMLLQQSRALWQMPFLNGRETGLRGEQYRENWRRETGTSVWNSTASGNGAVRTEGTVPEPEGSPKAVPLYPKPEGNGWPAAKQTEQAETEDRRQSEAQSGGRTYHINISKIADSVTVQNAQDADELAERTAKKIIEALDNTA